MNSTARTGTVHRTTKETDIELHLKLDGRGETDIQSGVSFMDHMLTLFGVHGFFDLSVKGSGDIEVDDHHTVEDLGICLGQAFKMALGDLSGICRYGFSVIPMDEALAQVTLDVSKQPPWSILTSTITDPGCICCTISSLTKHGATPASECVADITTSASFNAFNSTFG